MESKAALLSLLIDARVMSVLDEAKAKENIERRKAFARHAMNSANLS